MLSFLTPGLFATDDTAPSEQAKALARALAPDRGWYKGYPTQAELIAEFLLSGKATANDLAAADIFLRMQQTRDTAPLYAELESLAGKTSQAGKDGSDCLLATFLLTVRDRESDKRPVRVRALQSLERLSAQGFALAIARQCSHGKFHRNSRRQLCHFPYGFCL